VTLASAEFFIPREREREFIQIVELEDSGVNPISRLINIAGKGVVPLNISIMKAVLCTLANAAKAQGLRKFSL
jgi:hypothetical protein